MLEETKYCAPRLRKPTDKKSMRKAIARDVLLRLKEGSLEAASTYLAGADTVKWEAVETAIKMRDLMVSSPECRACAIGAAFTSGIRLYDGVKPNQLDSILSGARSTAAQKFFTKRQMSIMEMFFEVRTDYQKSLFGWIDVEWDYQGAYYIPKDKRMQLVFKSIAKTGEISLKEIKADFKKETDKLLKQRFIL